MTRYFIITGLDEGMPIKPYTVETDGLLPYECMVEQYGDKARYYEEISLDTYNHLVLFYNGVEDCYELRDMRELKEYYLAEKDQYIDFADFCSYHKLSAEDLEQLAFLLYAMGL